MGAKHLNGIKSMYVNGKASIIVKGVRASVSKLSVLGDKIILYPFGSSMCIWMH